MTDKVKGCLALLLICFLGMLAPDLIDADRTAEGWLDVLAYLSAFGAFVTFFATIVAIFHK